MQLCIYFSLFIIYFSLRELRSQRSEAVYLTAVTSGPADLRLVLHTCGDFPSGVPSGQQDASLCIKATGLSGRETLQPK